MAAQPRGEWRRSTPPGRMAVVDGKTMLVVGLGGIGSEVAKRAHALGMKVIATRASGRTGPEFVSYVGLPDELPKLASEADFVVNTAPLTPQTTGIFDAAFFAKMKPSAYFINVARGRSVVTAALVDALNNKKIAGAGLDVTDPEPLPPDHPLWKAPNVIITPHVANDSDLGFEAQVKVVQENLRRYLAGERMLSVVDVSKGLLRRECHAGGTAACRRFADAWRRKICRKREHGAICSQSVVIAGASSTRSRAAFVVDADAYFKAFVEAARHAQRSILITGWDFHSRTRLLCANGAGLRAGARPIFSTTWCGAIASCTSTS